jgi:cytochrome c oxidase subunit 2
MRRLVLSAAALLLAAAPAWAADVPQRVTVFFPSWSALIDPAARESIAIAANWAKQHPEARLTVTGYASTIGSQAANTLLSGLRAQVVADELATDGVERTRIAIDAAGAKSFVLDAVESRRVEIALGAP